MQRLIIVLILLLAAVTRAAYAAEAAERIKYKGGPAYMFRVYLCDKQGTGYSLERPSRFLSRRSLERRKRQGLPLDSTDLPVSNTYRRQVQATGVDIVGDSRWHNTLLVRSKDTTCLRRLRSLACVRHVRRVWQAPDSITPTTSRIKYHDHFEDWDFVNGQPYGKAYKQINVLQGDRLHDIGMAGQNMMIAVVDGGFKNVDRIPAFNSINICGIHDFVHPATPSIFAETDHGTKVLSAMAIATPYYYVGSAPRSSYWLLRSEDLQTEQEVEEDYWAMAVEFADSAGCDLINSSLGYSEYDSPDMSHKLWQLDGRTTFISQSASLLASKGIILVNSAGNSGMGPWKKIGVPADADDILTVGAVISDAPHHIAPFSSIGPSQDGRIKPDIVAVGASAFVVSGRGVIIEDMGTSFSAPIICGLTACLWQALPGLKAAELIQLIRQTGDNAEHPDNIYGYGIPNFWRAYMMGKMKTSPNPSKGGGA